MILPRDIFTTISGYLDFILFLYSGKGFNVEDLSLEFDISKWVLYKRVKYWEDQEYIIIITKVGKEGGKQYQYQITDKMKVYLKKSLSILSRKLSFGLEIKNT